MSIQIDYGYGLLSEVSPEKNKKSACKKVAIGVGIVLAVLVVIAIAATCIIMFWINGGKHLEFKDIFDSKFSAFTLESKWQTSGRFNWLNEEGCIMLTDAEKGTTSVALNVSAAYPGRTLETYVASPDAGTLLLIGVDPVKIWRHSRRSTYLVVNPATGASVQVGGTQGVLYGAWSPSVDIDAANDNRTYHIAYVEENNVFVSHVGFTPKTGALSVLSTEALTTDGSETVINGVNGWLYEEEVIHGATTLWWSPNGQYLAWLRTDESSVEAYSFPWYVPESPYPEERHVRYTKPGGVNPEADLMLYDFERNENLTVERPTKDEFYITTVAWLDESDGLLFKWLNRLQNMEHIARVDPTTGLVTEYASRSDDTWIPTTQIYPLRGCDKFATLASTNDYTQIFLYNRAGGAPTVITSNDFPVTALVGFDSQSGLVYYQAAPTPITRHIYAASIDGKTSTMLTSEAQGSWWSAACPDPAVADCTYMVLTNGGPAVPTHALYKARNSNSSRTTGDLELTTMLADNAALRTTLSGLKMPKIKYTTFRDASETYNLNAYVLEPPKIYLKRPVLFTVYGGPGSQKVTKEWYKDMFHMYLATQGYYVICVDGRGTGYRGDKFMKMIYKRMGILEMLDQVAAGQQVAKHVSMHGKIAIWGWSFGGYVTSMVMTNASKKGPFAAGVAVAPPTDWRFYDSAYTERYMQRPVDNPAGYEATAVLPNAKNIKDNTFFLVHGTADDNVHFMNSALLNDALVDADVRFRTMYYVNRDHSIRVGNSLPHLYRNIIDFLDQRLK